MLGCIYIFSSYTFSRLHVRLAVGNAYSKDIVLCHHSFLVRFFVFVHNDPTDAHEAISVGSAAKLPGACVVHVILWPLARVIGLDSEIKVPIHGLME